MNSTGYALLSIETTDELKSTYTSRQAAEDFNRPSAPDRKSAGS